MRKEKIRKPNQRSGSGSKGACHFYDIPLHESSPKDVDECLAVYRKINALPEPQQLRRFADHFLMIKIVKSDI